MNQNNSSGSISEHCLALPRLPANNDKVIYIKNEGADRRRKMGNREKGNGTGYPRVFHISAIVIT